MSTNNNILQISRKRKLSHVERFPDFDSNEIANKREGVKKKNTEKSDKKCEKIFTQWLYYHNFTGRRMYRL